MTLSVIIPCYNESATIAEVLRLVRAAVLPEGWEKQIIVVDDGSNEKTVAALKTLESQDVEIYFRSQNGGKGAAVKDGLRQAKGEYCIIQDADLEYDPA